MYTALHPIVSIMLQLNSFLHISNLGLLRHKTIRFSKYLFLYNPYLTIMHWWHKGFIEHHRAMPPSKFEHSTIFRCPKECMLKMHFAYNLFDFSLSIITYQSICIISDIVKQKSFIKGFWGFGVLGFWKSQVIQKSC